MSAIISDNERKLIETCGGTAFPSKMAAEAGGEFEFIGLTARDYFAAHAPEIGGDWYFPEEAPDVPSERGPARWSQYRKQHSEWSMRKASAWRYAYADAMLKARDAS